MIKRSLLEVVAAIVLGSTASLAKDEPHRKIQSDDSTSFPSPSWVMDPTPAPSSPCTGSTLNWVDVDGYGCDWYESNDMPSCPRYGNIFEGAMGVADDNCCYCFGTAAPMITPPPIPSPTYSPTLTRYPTTPFPTYSPSAIASQAPTTSITMFIDTTQFPTDATDGLEPNIERSPPCTGNTIDWVDIDGFGCEWWEENDSPGCPSYGNDFEGDMGKAIDNCCFCKME